MELKEWVIERWAGWVIQSAARVAARAQFPRWARGAGRWGPPPLGGAGWVGRLVGAEESVEALVRVWVALGAAQAAGLWEILPLEREGADLCPRAGRGVGPIRVWAVAGLALVGTRWPPGWGARWGPLPARTCRPARCLIPLIW